MTTTKYIGESEVCRNSFFIQTPACSVKSRDLKEAEK